MAEFKSVQYTQLTKTAPFGRLNSSDHNDLRTIYFEFTTPVGGVAINDTIVLAEIQAGAGVRIRGGEIAWEAMSSGAGDASGQIGTPAAATRYKNTLSMDAAGNTTFAKAISENVGELLVVDTKIQIKVLTEGFAAGKLIKGFIDYLQAV